MKSEMESLFMQLVKYSQELAEQVDVCKFADESGHFLELNQSWYDFVSTLTIAEAYFGNQKTNNKELGNMERYFEAVEGKTMISYNEYTALEKRIMEHPEKEKVSISSDIVVCPTYMTNSAVGADCFASEDVLIAPGAVALVPTGIKAKFNGASEGLFPFIRSSIPKKTGLILANGVGVIEEDYFGNPDNDGNIAFMMMNTSDKIVTVKRFDRIGQLVLLPILRFENAGYAGMERGASGSTGK